MIDKRLENLIGRIKSIHLTDDEKSEVLNRALLVIEKIEAVSISQPVFSRRVKSPFVSAVISYIEYKKFVPAFVIAALLFVSGGVSLAAEQALPGDSLFGLKKVNEEVLGFAALSPEAKARVALEVSERRLQEAATLSAQGKLTDARKVIIQKEFKKQADQVKNQVASLISQNDIVAAQEITLDFESSLKAHEDLIAKVSVEPVTIAAAIAAPSDAPQVSALLVTLKDEIATSTLSRVSLQNKELALSGNSAQTADARLKEVTSRLKKVKELKEKQSTTTVSLEVSIKDQKIKEAEDAIVQAQNYLSQNRYNDALSFIQFANRATSEVKQILLAEQNAHATVKTALVTSAAASSTATSTASTASASTTVETQPTVTPAPTTPAPAPASGDSSATVNTNTTNPTVPTPLINSGSSLKSTINSATGLSL